MDGIGMGLGFTVGIIAIAFFRELFGAGTLCGVQVMPSFYKPMDLLVKAPGAFLILGLIVMFMNAMSIQTRANDLVDGGCEGSCATCAVADKENCDKKEAKA
jgi:electron transport complex protein RnfE